MSPAIDGIKERKASLLYNGRKYSTDGSDSPNSYHLNDNQMEHSAF